MLMMLPKLATARRQIEKIAAEMIIFRQRCQGVNAGKRLAKRDLQQNGGGFVARWTARTNACRLCPATP
jgi:hypothetical protein